MKASKVTHFEIPADDVERARKFYQDVFGWSIVKEPQMGYMMVQTTETDEKTQMPREVGSINGGMIKREGKLKHPIVTLQVDDLDASLTGVKKAGGKVLVPKTEMGPIGWFGYFEDTEGNVMGVWQAARRA